MDKSIKRRWGDRRDGRWVRDVPGLTTIMMHIMPRRTAAEVYVNEKIDATELVKFIERKNAEHPDFPPIRRWGLGGKSCIKVTFWVWGP